ncbi:MAG: septum site-determining protein MinC [Cyanothece sp. SIO2G6]|nr:septum site-determining protein MinC [Cyanothece sp. SIO2G6]
MTSDSFVSASVSHLSPPEDGGSHSDLQIRFKSEANRLLLLMPPDGDGDANVNTWDELWSQLKQRLAGGERFWQPETSVHLIARDRLLDARQLQSIADILGSVQLRLKRVYTSRRQTAIAAVTQGYSVEQDPPVAHLNQSANDVNQPLADPLYIQTTVRSGMEIRHPGTIVVLGDVNPGGTIVADGDVIIWGRLKGIAQAGASGNQRCLIMALRMEPTQIRIANLVARAPENPPSEYYPEVAYAMAEGIRITKASAFKIPYGTGA